MKQIIYILICTLLLFSCRNKTSKTGDKIPIDTLQTVLTNKLHSTIYIKDSSQYDQIFIDGLSEYNEPIQLIDKFIVTGKDTTFFPEDLVLNKKTIFKGTQGDNEFVLTVVRTNLTNLKYEFQLTNKDNKTIDSKSGKAILGSLFFLASEVDEDNQTGDAYGSSEYWDKSNDCWFSIRIGIGLDSNGKKRAMLTFGCEDKNQKSLDLDGCPTLRTE